MRSAAAPESLSKGIAKRLRNNAESAPGTVVMTTVVCYQCGARFAIAHQLAFRDQALADRQAIWLADKFVWDHIQESNHQSSIELPGSREIK